jgi:hypothetical protein
MEELLSAQDVRVARVERELGEAVTVVSDWSLPLDPDPLHGPPLDPGDHLLADRSGRPVTRITDAT